MHLVKNPAMIGSIYNYKVGIVWGECGLHVMNAGSVIYSSRVCMVWLLYTDVKAFIHNRLSPNYQVSTAIDVLCLAMVAS